MKHFYIDKYSEIESFLHSVDPRVKIITIFTLILSLVLTPPSSFFSFALYSLVIVILILISRVPPMFILKRSLVIIPFVLMVAIFIPFLKKGEVAGAYSFGTLQLRVTYSGLLVFWNVLVKSYLSVLSMILLMTTTRFSDLLKALERLHFPRIFTMILMFMYRYIFVLQDELMKMLQARKARSVSRSKWLDIKVLANMLGVLFLRAFERGERVYSAMCSRGFQGAMRTMHNFQIKEKDMYFLFIFAGILVVIRIIGV